jgi:hypothetical protein
MRERLKLVKPADVLALNSLVDNGEDPDQELLKRAFPNAFYPFGEFMGADPLSVKSWPVEIVSAFWRLHTGREPRCAVMHGKVEEAKMLLGNMVRVKLESGRIMIVANRFKLAVLKRDTVFFHRDVIAEVELAD